MAAAWVRRFGYPDAEVTPPGPDDGIDVRSIGAVAQVKWWNTKNAGIEEVQRIAGCAEPGQQSFFFVRNGYTRAAARWLEPPDCPVAAFILYANGDVAPVNVASKTVVRRTTPRIPSAQRVPVGPWLNTTTSVVLIVVAILHSLLLSLALQHWTVRMEYFLALAMIVLMLVTEAALLKQLRVPQELLRVLKEVRSARKGGGWSGWRKVLTRPLIPVRDAGLPPDLFAGYLRSNADRLVDVSLRVEATTYRLRRRRHLRHARHRDRHAF